MRTNSVLITGVAGLVGSNLASHLKSRMSVVGVDNMLGGYRDNVPSDIEFLETGCEDTPMDVLAKCDIVVHSACTPHEGLSVFSPSLITHHTFGVSMELLSRSIAAGVRKFIFLSSMARYGSQPRIPFTEEMVPKPQDPYGIAKYAFELSLQNLAETHGLEFVIVVPHNIIGVGQKYNDPFRNVAAIMMNRMLRGKQPIIYGDGSQMRSFSDIRDVVSPLETLVFSNAGSGHVINIGPDDNFISINELAERIATTIDFRLDPIYVPSRPREIHLANCSAEKARKILRYRPEISLDKTLADMVAWVEKRGTLPFDHSLPLEIETELTPITWKDKNFFDV